MAHAHRIIAMALVVTLGCGVETDSLGGVLDAAVEASTEEEVDAGKQSENPEGSTEAQREPGALTAALAAGARLTAQTTGAKVSGELVWRSANEFELKNVRLEDTACDGSAAFFYVAIPGFSFPKHWNRSGCHTTVSSGSLRGSSRAIHSAWLVACRDGVVSDSCKRSASTVNPNQ